MKNQQVARVSRQEIAKLPLSDAIEVLAPQLADALPENMPLRRFKRTALTALNQNPKLAEANRRTFFNALLKCAHDGLYPDGREAALVVFGSEVAYLPMIAGIRKRLRNSGEVLSATAEVVHKNDVFHFRKGEDPSIQHEPPPLDQDRGPPVGAYAIIKLSNGEIIREVMAFHEIERVRAFSRSRNDGPWVTSWGEMARKTVLRRAAKSAPTDSVLDRLLARDDEAEEEYRLAHPAPPRPTRDQFIGSEDHVPESEDDYPNGEDTAIEAGAEEEPEIEEPAVDIEPEPPAQKKRERPTRDPVKANTETEASLTARKVEADRSAPMAGERAFYICDTADGGVLHENLSLAEANVALKDVFDRAARIGMDELKEAASRNDHFTDALGDDDLNELRAYYAEKLAEAATRAEDDSPPSDTGESEEANSGPLPLAETASEEEGKDEFPESDVVDEAEEVEEVEEVEEEPDPEPEPEPQPAPQAAAKVIPFDSSKPQTVFAPLRMELGAMRNRHATGPEFEAFRVANQPGLEALRGSFATWYRTLDHLISEGESGKWAE